MKKISTDILLFLLKTKIFLPTAIIIFLLMPIFSLNHEEDLVKILPKAACFLLVLVIVAAIARSLINEKV